MVTFLICVHPVKKWPKEIRVMHSLMLQYYDLSIKSRNSAYPQFWFKSVYNDSNRSTFLLSLCRFQCRKLLVSQRPVLNSALLGSSPSQSSLYSWKPVFDSKIIIMTIIWGLFSFFLSFFKQTTSCHCHRYATACCLQNHPGTPPATSSCTSSTAMWTLDWL